MEGHGSGPDLSLVPTGPRHNGNGSSILLFLTKVSSGSPRTRSGPFIVMIFHLYPIIYIYIFSFKPFLCAMLLCKDAKVALRAADDAVILKTEAKT